jgi:hypothetical protein
MKNRVLRVLVVVAALPLAWWVAGTAASFSTRSLASGGREGTPVTVVVSLAAFAASFVVCVTAGTLALNRLLGANRSTYER